MFRVLVPISKSSFRPLSTIPDIKINKKTQFQKEEVKESNPLLDTFGRYHTYLRISLTEKCNLRCTYCMPAEGIKLTQSEKLLTASEIVTLAKIFVKEGVKKIRLTGGEPTVRKDLTDIIGSLKEIDGLETVALTTNGLVLTKKLVALQRAGLDQINVSLDTLDPKRYEKITRRKGWERVMMGVDLALQLGYSPVKLNCVIIKGFNCDEICNFVEMTKDKDLDVRFIEYMPFSGNKWEMGKMIPYNDMISIIRGRWPEFRPLENKPNDTSKAWKVPGFIGQVGFITSMSEHFCGSCNRLRITADGNLKVCLFGNTEVSLRDAIRAGCSEDDLTALISAAVKRKKRQHAEKSHQKLPILCQMHTTHPHLFLSFTSNVSSLRLYSTKSSQLTHIDAEGKASMVDISPKGVTKRIATAAATVRINDQLKNLISKNQLKKGDVLSAAQIAGVIGAKKTSELIPLCHNIPLNHVKVAVTLDEKENLVKICASVKCEGKTGVEMEALTAATVAALTVYDMCKAVSRDIVIDNIHLISKTGGSRGDYNRQ